MSYGTQNFRATRLRYTPLPSKSLILNDCRAGTDRLQCSNGRRNSTL